MCVTTAQGSFCMRDAPPDAAADPANTVDAAIDAGIELPLDAPHLAITRVQQSQPMTVDGSVGSLAVQWPTPTQDGNLLVACMGLRWAGAIAVDAPPGWQQAADASPQSGESRVVIWYIPTAAARSGAETWTFTNGVTYEVAVAMFEYAGPTALDRVTTQTGTGTTITTGTTATTTAARELWFACTDVTGAYPQSAPSNGFTVLDEARVGSPNNGLSAAWFERIVSDTGVATTSTTITTAREWSAALVTFR